MTRPALIPRLIDGLGRRRDADVDRAPTPTPRGAEPQHREAKRGTP